MDITAPFAVSVIVADLASFGAVAAVVVSVVFFIDSTFRGREIAVARTLAGTIKNSKPARHLGTREFP
jgi:hypothetical protein